MNPPKNRCENLKYCNREDEEKPERKRGIRIRKGKQKHIRNNIKNHE
jgi:SRSO17 transposase